MPNFKKLVSLSYLFQTEGVILSRSDKIFFMAACLSLLLSVVFKIAELMSKNPVDKNFRGKYFNLFLTLAIWELVWFGSRYESVRFFGSHFVALLGFIVAGVWFVLLTIKMAKEYRPAVSAWEKEQVRLKYLPK